MTIKLLQGEAAIRKAIGSIKTRGKKLDRDIQQAALSVIMHTEKHSDTSVLNHLVDALPKGSRVNALRDYLLTFAKVAWDEDNKCFVLNRDKVTDMEGAHAIMWTEFKPEPEFKPLDLMDSLAKILKKADKQASENGVKFDVNAMNTLRTLVEAA